MVFDIFRAYTSLQVALQPIALGAGDVTVRTRQSDGILHQGSQQKHTGKISKNTLSTQCASCIYLHPPKQTLPRLPILCSKAPLVNLPVPTGFDRPPSWFFEGTDRRKCCGQFHGAHTP